MPGSLHPSGRLYEAIQGDFTAIPTVSQDVANFLIAAARKLDEAPLTRQQMEAKRKSAPTIDRHRAESNGQASVIDSYNAKVTIDAELKAHGYDQQGDRWTRPGGKSLSVFVKEGRSYHHSSNDPLNDGYWHSAFDVFCQLEHGGDCRAAVKAAADRLGLSSFNPSDDDGPDVDLSGILQANGEPAVRPAAPAPKERFPLVTSEELDSEDYAPRWLILDVLCALVPAVVGGSFKTCKTLIAIAQAIALASGRPFLNVFCVPEPLIVIYFSGEGGRATAQDYGRRIVRSMGMSLRDLKNLHWCFSVPRLESLADLKAMVQKIDQTGAKVIFIDNTTLAPSGEDAGNVMKMGQILGNLIRACDERGVTPVLVHHFKRTRANGDQFAPGELIDLTQAGMAEIAGQWALLTRREPFNPDNAGEHKLWLSIGGRLVDSSLHALDIHEGRRTDPGGRVWQPVVMPATDAREDADARRDAAKRQRTAQTAAVVLEADRNELVRVATRLKTPQTERDLRGNVSFQKDRFKKALASLVDDGNMQPTEIIKRNSQSYPAWKLREPTEP